jgi:hypothetical protein
MQKEEMEEMDGLDQEDHHQLTTIQETEDQEVVEDLMEETAVQELL